MFVTTENFYTEVLKVNKPVFVEVGADWSGTSHIIAPIIKQLALKYKGQVKFVKLVTDGNKELISKYGIDDIPVLLVFKNGEIEDYIKGVFSSNELENKICALLENNQ
jgi:thioredoxin